MKKYLSGLMAVAMLTFYGLFAAVTSASAIVIKDTNENVGDLDGFRAAFFLKNSDEKKELETVENFLGMDLVYVKDDTSGGAGWKETDNTGTYAFELEISPDYFMIKTGNTNAAGNNHFLFDNKESFDWAVVNLSQIYGGGYTTLNNLNIGRFSHLNEYDAGTTSVPEPATLMLLGAGLLGFAVYGKRRMNKKD